MEYKGQSPSPEEVVKSGGFSNFYTDKVDKKHFFWSIAEVFRFQCQKFQVLRSLGRKQSHFTHLRLQKNDGFQNVLLQITLTYFWNVFGINIL